MPQPYAHLLKDEASLWHEFITRFPARFDRVQYDYHLGPAPPAPHSTEVNLERLVERNYRRRIDALGWNGTQATIVEIRPAADSPSFGQLLLYSSLFQIENPSLPPPKLLLITDGLKPDVFDLCTKHNIETCLLPDVLSR